MRYHTYNSVPNYLTNYMSYSYSYSPQVDSFSLREKGASTGNGDAGAPLYALGDLQFIPVEAGATLILNRANGQQQVVTPDVARALNECARFASISAHTDSIVRAIPELAQQRELVRSTLEQLANAGILSSAEAQCARLNRKNEEATRSRTRVFIITCDRPGALEKLLESMASMQGLSRHEAFFLIDSSRNANNVDRNRELVELFNTRSAKNIAHICPQKQKDLCARFCEELPEHAEGIRFLLDRNLHSDYANYGMARNFCLLLAMGKRAVILDDDILAYRLKAPESTDSFAFEGGVASEVRFFPDLQTVLGNIEALEDSALDGISHCLGLPLADVPAAMGEEHFNELQLHGAPGVIMETLQGQSRVLVTQCGTLGDPGTEGLAWLHQLDGPSQKSLLAALGNAGTGRVERWCWRGTRTTTIAKMASMSQLTGLDNSELLPPYFPYFRGEDLLFGAAVDFIHPQAAILEYNWCVAHIPENRRPPLDLRADPITGSGSVGLIARRISDAVDSRSGTTPAQRLEQLARLLEADAARDDQALSMEYRASKAIATTAQMNAAFSLLQGQPAQAESPWRDFLKRSVEEYQAALVHPWRPGDLVDRPDPQGDEQALTALRGMLRGYVAGLDAWPAVRDRAADVIAALDR